MKSAVSLSSPNAFGLGTPKTLIAIPSVEQVSGSVGAASLENRIHAASRSWANTPTLRSSGLSGSISRCPRATPWSLRKTGRSAGLWPRLMRLHCTMSTNISTSRSVGVVSQSHSGNARPSCSPLTEPSPENGTSSTAIMEQDPSPRRITNRLLGGPILCPGWSPNKASGSVRDRACWCTLPIAVSLGGRGAGALRCDRRVPNSPAPINPKPAQGGKERCQALAYGPLALAFVAPQLAIMEGGRIIKSQRRKSTCRAASTSVSPRHAPPWPA